MFSKFLTLLLCLGWAQTGSAREEISDLPKLLNGQPLILVSYPGEFRRFEGVLALQWQGETNGIYAIKFPGTFLQGCDVRVMMAKDDRGFVLANGSIYNCLDSASRSVEFHCHFGLQLEGQRDREFVGTGICSSRTEEYYEMFIGVGD